MTAFSTIIATHNRPWLVARAIESVKRQSIGPSQVIVVSDADCAGTREIARRLLSGSDLFVQRTGGSRGPAASRNLGMRLADGDLFVFLDDDDAFSPDFFRDIAQHRDDEFVLFTNHHTVLEDFNDGRSEVREVQVKSLLGKRTDDIYVRNYIPLHCLVYPRALAGRIAFDDTLDYEDWDFILQAMACKPLRHVDIFGPIIFSRIEGSRSVTSMPNLFETYRRVYARYPSDDPRIVAARNALIPPAPAETATEASAAA